jgi:PadR family transcriptional regulator, regulatory protein PadR
VRRKAGQLVPLEIAICQAAVNLRATGVDVFHGYQLATALADAADVRQLTAYGTLYRALSRLDTMGFLTSEWEDPVAHAQESRPRRRLYSLTPAGEAALAEAQPKRAVAPRARAPRLARA